MFDILSLIPSKKKNTTKGWYSFNCPFCVYHGHRPDKRSRGGIKFVDSNNWAFNCFNCLYKFGFKLGQSIPIKTRQALVWLGCDNEQIQKWNLESLRHKDILDFSNPVKTSILPVFKTLELPNGELLDEYNNIHQPYIKYLTNRGISHKDYPFLITPNESGRNKNRIIVPYTYKNNIVGHTSRYIDNRTPKYINEQQPGYIFGYDFQKQKNAVCILVEGVFDALSINGCALLHNDISNEQRILISNLNKRVIFVPDRDKSGLKLCDKALEFGYNVSIPSWDKSIKDVNDAVVRYGKLPTLLSILQSATTSKIKVDIFRRKLLGR